MGETAMIMERYIAGNLVKGWLLVLLVLGAVFGLIGFVQELDDTRFDYDALAVGRYTLFILPQSVISATINCTGNRPLRLISRFKSYSPLSLLSSASNCRGPNRKI